MELQAQLEKTRELLDESNSKVRAEAVFVCMSVCYITVIVVG